MIEEASPPFVLQTALHTHYNNLVYDRHGDLWAYGGNRISRVDPVTKRVKTTYSIGREVSVEGLFFDSANRGWASTWEGGILEIGPSCVTGEVHGDFSKSVVYKGLEWEFNGRRYLVFGTSTGRGYSS